MLKNYMSYEQFSSLFIINKMRLLIHFLAISVSVPPICSIILLSYFSLFLLWYLESCCIMTSGKSCCLMGYNGKQSWKLFIGLSLSMKLMAPICTPGWHCDDWFSAYREGWLSIGYLILTFSYHHQYILVHCAKQVIYSISFNPYNNSKKAGTLISFSQVRKSSPGKGQ